MSAAKLTVHMVGNAHLDPVWLWRRAAGIDATIATCRTACELLDAYPELRFTKGEAWTYATLERYAPAVFERVAAHIAAGRWCLVGGWWVQPDCNFPLAASFMQQHRLGQAFFADRFDRRVRVGYNVDSFGHGGWLPSLLTRMGMHSYVFMRPGPHEMELPGGAFRWQAPDGASVLSYRIRGNYASQTLVELQRNVDETIAATPDGARHAMCFYGVGDHGGGPTREQIEWIIAHRDYGDGVRLVFSDPETFFAAIEAGHADLPTVHGELQQHAIGCYSVGHRYRQLLRTAERTATMAGGLLGDAQDGIWRSIAFAQFHDLAGGCSIPGAMADAERDLQAVLAVCDEHLDDAVRTEVADCPPHRLQRLVLRNCAAVDHPGPQLVEPWVGYPIVEDLDHATVIFHDEAGAVVSSQAVLPAAAARLTRAWLLDLGVPAEGSRVVTIEVERTQECVARPEARHRPAAQTAGSGRAQVELQADGLGRCGDWLRTARLTVHDDPGDTWSHGLDRYPREACDRFRADACWTQTEDGPLRWRFVNGFTCASGRCRWSLGGFEGHPRLELQLDVDWIGVQQVLKLHLEPGFTVHTRADGVPGGMLARALDGRELPFQRGIHLAGDDGAGLTLVTDDAYAADVQPDGALRVTLLRSPYLAHHEPFAADAPGMSYPVSDQGHHRYRIALMPGVVDEALLERELLRLGEPLRWGESTVGMPDR